MKINPPAFEAIAASAAAIFSGENLFAGIKNSYGNFDGKKTLPVGLVTISGESNARVWRACRKLGIPYLQVLQGFSRSGKFFAPRFDGAVISAIDWDRLARHLWPEWEARQASLEALSDVEARRAADRSFEPESEWMYA